MFNNLSHEVALHKFQSLKQNHITQGETRISEPSDSATQFGNYSLFEKSFAQLKEKNLLHDGLTQEDYIGKNVDHFIRSLSSDYIEKR